MIISIASITIAALLYVHQQVELVKLSYAIENKECILKDMLDFKEGLRYNIKNLEDPSRLEKVLISQKINMTFPRRDHIVKMPKTSLDIAGKEGIGAMGLERKTGLFGILDFLNPRAEAQVKEK